MKSANLMTAFLASLILSFCAIGQAQSKTEVPNQLASFFGKYDIDQSNSDVTCQNQNYPGIYEIQPTTRATGESGIELKTPYASFSFSTLSSKDSATVDDAGPSRLTTTRTFDGRSFKYKYVHMELILVAIIPIPYRSSTYREVTQNDDGSITLKGNFLSELDEDGSKRIQCRLVKMK